MSSETKTRRVLRHLLNKMELTPKEAYLKYGTMRLGAIIHNLQKQGHSIVNLHPKGEYAKYKIQA